MERAPLQTYGFALVFSPAMSEVKKMLWDARLPFIYWDAHRQTLEGHDGPFTAIAFSPDGKMLASASFDDTMRLWDMGTGTPRQTLKSHGGPVMVIALSPDGKIVALASHDGTLRLWDVAAGTPRQTLESCDNWLRGNWARAVAFSPVPLREHDNGSEQAHA
ncbi:Ankyrin repeat-containing domain protein [Purpureocillium lavendulum]|uniref:Ankyrin repeat-containing domain protein n=1 Tax=Purpureocillium lavendulum TaxID=1247861 RepID=A0AB34FC18_9HYPO|nr:Ankyrin repeat-containing domain protein [Purpureocillium lavendulum]